MIFEWSKGRQLSSYTKGDSTVNYTYDSNGMRLTKTVDGVKHTYLYENGLLVQETRGDVIFDYSYDANGSIRMLKYRANASASPSYFYYALNTRGDVIGLYNASGTLIANYTYDPWGNTVSITDGAGNDISNTTGLAVTQPFRYRSYYYDMETGFYLTGTRYYDPITHRFINADEEMSDVGGNVLGYNLFAYCFNNPVNMDDPTGQWPKWVSGALNIVGGALQIATGVALGATVGWTGVGAAVACFLVANGAAQTVQGIGQVVNHVTKSNTMREDNTLRTSVQTVGNDVGGKTGEKVAGYAYDAAVFAANVYAGATLYTPSACFVAGTSILTSCGSKMIEEIKVGDFVWSNNTDTGEKSIKKVIQTFENETSELVYILINGVEIITTPEHPFYSPVIGWQEARKLRTGDTLVTQSGQYVTIEKVEYEILETPITVYNFEVEDFHTYYVGNSAVLVHNTCQQFTPNQQAVIDLAREYRNGISRSDANTLVGWAQEYGIKSFHGPKIHPNRSGIWSYTEHIKIFNIHIPIK